MRLFARSKRGYIKPRKRQVKPLYLLRGSSIIAGKNSRIIDCEPISNAAFPLAEDDVRFVAHFPKVSWWPSIGSGKRTVRETDPDLKDDHREDEGQC